MYYNIVKADFGHATTMRCFQCSHYLCLLKNVRTYWITIICCKAFYGTAQLNTAIQNAICNITT